MITPSKLTSLDDSILSKLEPVLRAVSGDIPIRDLYHQVAAKFSSVEEFMLAVDILYIVGKVDVRMPDAVISNAD